MDKASSTQDPFGKALLYLPQYAFDKIADIFVCADVITASPRELQPATVSFWHDFKLSVETPVHHEAVRMAPRHNEVLWKEVQDVLKAGIITPASSSRSFPVLIFTKKDGKPQLARELIFKTLVLFSGYWQIKLSKSCKERRTFIFRTKTFQFEVMPFALMNAPSTFQRMVNNFFGQLGFVRVYPDNFNIFSRTLMDHLYHVQQVVHLIAMSVMIFEILECEFAQQKLTFLSHVTNEYGIEVTTSEVRAIRDISRPSK